MEEGEGEGEEGSGCCGGAGGGGGGEGFWGFGTLMGGVVRGHTPVEQGYTYN